VWHTHLSREMTPQTLTYQLWSLGAGKGAETDGVVEKRRGRCARIELSRRSISKGRQVQKKRTEKKTYGGIEQKTTQCLSGLGLSGARAMLVHLTIPTPEPLGCDGGWDVR
jgi:hypothetical protein